MIWLPNLSLQIVFAAFPAGRSLRTRSMATIYDVARVAGVSITTVSHVLNGTRHVNEDTKSRVVRAVEELGYRPGN